MSSINPISPTGKDSMNPWDPSSVLYDPTLAPLAPTNGSSGNTPEEMRFMLNIQSASSHDRDDDLQKRLRDPKDPISLVYDPSLALASSTTIIDDSSSDDKSATRVDEDERGSYQEGGEGNSPADLGRKLRRFGRSM